jgi:hypothetical protein
MLRYLLIAVAIIFVGIGTQANAALITIQPDSIAGKDAAINNQGISSLNWGSLPYLTINFGTTDQFGLIEFDLSAYSGQAIQSASLQLFAELNPFAGQVYSVSKNLGSWTESTVTYNTAPAVGPVLDTITTLNGPRWYAFDVTTAVSDWLGGEANYGFRLSETNGFVYFRSSDFPDAQFRPLLQFDTAPVPEPGTWMLMSTGLVALLSYGWRKRQRQTA